jgi:hypothetical protein
MKIRKFEILKIEKICNKTFTVYYKGIINKKWVTNKKLYFIGNNESEIYEIAMKRFGGII